MPDHTRSVEPGPATFSATAPGVTGSVVDPNATTGTGEGTFASEPTVPARRYELGAEIARGGMGAVYQATDIAFGREVAVKVLLDKFAPTSGTAQRFGDEARITGQLQHPNIPAVHDLGTLPDGRPFLAMKLVRGRTLAGLLNARPDPAHDLPRFVSVFEQVCQAVGYAHSQGVVHRDIKPANVMVGAFGEVQVMDWGLAFEPATDAVEAGMVMGTPAHMAPEQARGEPVDARADVFALGGMLCEMLTGRRPFVGKSAAEARQRAAAADLGEAHDRLGACGADRELVELAKRCLSAARDARPADGTAVAAEVAAYRAGVEERLRAVERERVAAEAKAAEQRKRRRTQLALATAVTMLVVGAAGVGWWQSAQSADRALERERATTERTRLEMDRRAAELQKELDDELRAAAAMALLTRAAEALGRNDPARAALALDAAEKQVGESRTAAFTARLADLRADQAVLKELDAIEAYRWIPLENRLPSQDLVAVRYRGVLGRFGADPDVVPPGDAARRVAGSTVRERLLAALHWVLMVGRSDRLRAALGAADPDPFRTEVRAAVRAGDAVKLAELVARPAAADQPFGVLAVLGENYDLPPDLRRELLAAAAHRRPDSCGLLLALGNTYRTDKNDFVAERLRWYQAAVGADPANVAARTNLAATLFDGGDRAAAVAEYRVAVGLAPDLAQPRYNLGTALGELGDVRGAVTELRAAVRLDPTVPLFHYNLGLALVNAGDLAAAAAEFREAIRIGPDESRFHNNLGIVLRRQGKVAEAIAECRAAVRLDETSANARYNLGRYLIEAKQPNAALVEFQKLAQIDPRNTKAHYTLGYLFHHKGDTDRAITHFRESLRIDPKNRLSRDGLRVALETKAAALVAAGDVANGIRQYRDALRVEPDSSNLHYNLGVILWQNRDVDGAIAEYREAIRCDPTFALAHNNLGVALGRTGEPAEAMASFLAAVRLDPRLASAHTNLGGSYRAFGRYDEAIAAYRTALALQPTNATARAGLDYVLRLQRGEVQTAPPPREAKR